MDEGEGEHALELLADARTPALRHGARAAADEGLASVFAVPGATQGRRGDGWSILVDPIYRGTSQHPGPIRRTAVAAYRGPTGARVYARLCRDLADATKVVSAS